jgi:hypothetical protein
LITFKRGEDTEELQVQGSSEKDLLVCSAVFKEYSGVLLSLKVIYQIFAFFIRYKRFVSDIW